jgi:hypothetical protein
MRSRLRYVLPGVHWVRFSASDDDLPDSVVVAIEAFEPVVPSRDADAAVSDWLKRDAFHESASEVCLLIKDGTVVAYHTACVADCELSDGTVVPALHCRFAARHRDHPRQGRVIVEHMSELGRQAGVAWLSVDPFDEQAEKPWKALGFTESATRAHDDPTLERYRLHRPA